MKPTLVAALAAAVAACAGAARPVPPPTPAATEPTSEPQATTATELPGPAFPDEPFRAQPPEATAPRPFQLPAIQQFSLRNGIDVYLVERHELPTVSMQLRFAGGAIDDPQGKAGLASVCMSMLTEGTRELDKLAFQEALANTASGVSSGAGTELQSVSMYALTEHVPATLDLLLASVRTPGLREAEFARLVERRVEAVKQAKGSTASIAGRVIDAIYYGPAHPYGRLDTEASLRAITLADCKRHHRAYVKPKGAKLFVVGDITEAELRQGFGARVADWRGAPKRTVQVPKPSPMQGRLFLVDVPNAAQSSVTLGNLGPLRTADDYFASSLLSAIFGGGFSSRLNQNLREDKGWAYGAGGGFDYRLTSSVLSARAQVQTDKTAESLAELQREYLALHTGERPPTEAELTREQQSAVLSLPGKFETANAALDRYEGLVSFGLPLDYYDHYIDNVQAVTSEQILAAARRHFKPAELRALVVGDTATVMPGLLAMAAEQALGGGDLVVLDADGKVRERITREQARAKLDEASP